MPMKSSRPARKSTAEAPPPPDSRSRPPKAQPPGPEEVGGRNGPEPTRYGDWEKNGICSDF